jgi:serine/threonine protein kinase
MAAKHTERIEEILEHVEQLPPTEQHDYVSRTCGDDSALAKEVYSLMAARDEESLEELLEHGLPQLKGNVARSYSLNSSYAHANDPEDREWIGKTINAGHYRITKRLRSGQLASLFEAEDLTLGNKKRIIKIPRLRGYVQSEADGIEAEDEKANLRRNFTLEYNALLKIESNYVVQVLAFGKLDDDRPFIVQEYIHGMNALELLSDETAKKHQLNFSDVANIIEKAGRGLTAAHEKRVLHLDVKPANIMVSDGGDVVKLIDFNAAAVAFPITPVTTVLLPQTWGTPGYASPEQIATMELGIDPVELTPASDIYSLAVTAYQLLTGKMPSGNTNAGKLRAGVSQEIDELLNKALDSDPSRRPQSAKQFGQDLANALRRIGSKDAEIVEGDRGQRQLKPLRTLFAVAAVILLLLVGGYIGWLILSSKPSGLAPITSTTPTVPSEKRPASIPRSFTYWLDLTRTVDGKPAGGVIKASGKEVFIYRDSIVMNFVSPQTGYMYLLNEGRNYKDAITFYFEGKFRVRANERLSSTRLGFDNKAGIESFWVLFSNSPVTLLEEYDSPREIPIEKTEQLRNFLTQYVIAESSAKEDMANAQTNVESSGDTIAYKIDLRHRKAD